jgi:uncharacterized membrane protein
MLYIKATNRVLPSMYGAISVLLPVGAIGWVIFLFICKLPLLYSVFSFIIFCEGVLVWTQINYITAVKDYKSVILGFVVGVVLALSVGFLLAYYYKFDVVASLLFGACLGYGVIMLDFTIVLHKYFPMGSGSPLRFLEWIDRYPPLAFVGFFSTLGLFTHLMLMWSSPWGVQVYGLFYFAPAHDIPAFLAFFTTLMTAVNFVTSVEVRFYSKYRMYFSLLNGDGSLINVERGYEEMTTVLRQELFYLAVQQVFVTILAVVVVGEFLNYFGLGFNSVMIGLFRILCVGYGLFAIGNSLMLFLLYFSDNWGAFLSVAAFVLVNAAGTLFVITLPEVFYGFGFLAAGMALYLVALMRLAYYTKRLDYFIFSKQPVFFKKKAGLFTGLAHKLDSNNLELQ